jgi:hypothetical protein
MEWSNSNFDVLDYNSDALEFITKELNHFFDFEHSYSMITGDDEIKWDDFLQDMKDDTEVSLLIPFAYDHFFSLENRR